MKRKLLFLPFLLFCYFTLFSQDKGSIPSLFDVIGPPSAQDLVRAAGESRMKNMMENPMNIEIRKVRLNNLGEMARTKGLSKESPAYFEISLPRGDKTKKIDNVLAIPKQIEAKENGDYHYIAELVNGKNTKGHLVLIHENGKNFGSMTIGDRTFRLASDEVGGDLLIEINKEILDSEISCGTGLGRENTSKQTAKTPLKTQALALKATSRTVRVLVLYTDAADNVSNPAQVATTMMAQTSSILSNTKVYSSQLRFNLVGTRRIAFDETNNPVTDLDDAVADQEINNLRDNLGADLVVVLTDGNYNTQYGTVLGIAALDDYQDPDLGFVALVEADVGGYTFSHELAHLMGCRHLDDSRTLPNLNAISKGHQWYKRNCFFCQKLYRKSTTAGGNIGGLYTPFYSNPAVKSESKARDNTGTSTRNNYQQLVAAAPIVAGYNDFDEMTVGIIGPFFVSIGDPYTLTANVTNCASRTYRWEISYDGFTYYNAGSGSSYSGLAYPYNPNTLYHRLTVTCSDGQVRTAYQTVYVEGGGGGPLALREEVQEDRSVLQQNSLSDGQDFLMYPNPATDEVILFADFKGEEKVTVSVYGISPMGYEKRLFKGKLMEGQKELGLDVSGLPQGLYQVVVHSNGRELVGKRLLISR